MEYLLKRITMLMMMMMVTIPDYINSAAREQRSLKRELKFEIAYYLKCVMLKSVSDATNAFSRRAVSRDLYLFR